VGVVGGLEVLLELLLAGRSVCGPVAALRVGVRLL